MKIWTWVILRLREPWYLNERVNRKKRSRAAIVIRSVLGPFNSVSSSKVVLNGLPLF